MVWMRGDSLVNGLRMLLFTPSLGMIQLRGRSKAEFRQKFNPHSGDIFHHFSKESVEENWQTPLK
jgi:hypothetical protein